jgi:hypothetical protein
MKNHILKLLADGGQPHEMQILHEDGNFKVIPEIWAEMHLDKLEKILENAHIQIEMENRDRYQTLGEANEKANVYGYEIEYGLSGEIDGITKL